MQPTEQEETLTAKIDETVRQLKKQIDWQLTTITENVVTPDSYRKSFIRYPLSNEPPPPL